MAGLDEGELMARAVGPGRGGARLRARGRDGDASSRSSAPATTAGTRCMPRSLARGRLDAVAVHHAERA